MEVRGPDQRETGAELGWLARPRGGKQVLKALHRVGTRDAVVGIRVP